MASETQQWKVCLSEIDFGEEEESAVLEVLRSKWLTMGARTAAFEERFASLCGASHGVAVNNGTAALHLALLAVGVGSGDEVIVPSLTFVATVNAVLYCGATPVFADIQGPSRLLLDPRDTESKITGRTRAIIPMHYGGYCCDMAAFLQMADRHGLKIVEDAAHAPGSTWNGKPVGSIGDATCFSFFSNKNLVTGEGGMVTTSDDDVAPFVRINRSHGMTALSFDKHKGHAFTYDVVNSGYNYRLGEIQAALGLVQLEKLAANNARRRSLVRIYHERLADNPDITVPFLGMEGESSCHLQPVLLPERVDRSAFQAQLKSKGIQTSVHYPPVHRFTQFRGRFRADVPLVDAVADRIVTLPLHPLMSEQDVDMICRALEESIRENRHP